MTGIIKLGRSKLLNLNRDYLYEHYIVLEQSTVKIAKSFDCDPASIRYWLEKYDIPRRSLSYSHRINGYEFHGDEDILFGSLLGDASLLRRNVKNGSGLASFSKANIGYDHIWLVGQEILGQDPVDRIYEYKHKAVFD